MLRGEDDVASIVRPRLEAARADLAKVFGVTSRRHGKTWVWSLPAQGRKDAAPLEQDGLAVFEDGDSEEGCQP